MKEMTLEIQNFGPINQAEIDIGKITILAGPNASGKTTTSKLLYCFLASVSSDGEYLADKSIKDNFDRILVRLLNSMFKSNVGMPEELLDSYFKLSIEKNNDNTPLGKVNEGYAKVMKLLDTIEINNKEAFVKELNLIKELSEKKDNTEVYGNIMNRLLEEEFDIKEIGDNCGRSIAKFYGRNDKCKFENIIDSDSQRLKGRLNENYLKCVLVNEISYLETPYILDFLKNFDSDSNLNSSPCYHQMALVKKLKDNSKRGDVFDDVFNKEIINFQDKINNIIKGKFTFDKNKEFKFVRNGKTAGMRNTSSGIKQLGIIHLLLENRKLPADSFLIMDEPEVHLHPEWQIKLAEIIVLLAKELNVTIYINSHSPQFIEAIEVYSEYHEMNQNINFYLTESCEDGRFNINKVEWNNLVKIYECLGKPYDYIDDLRGRIDAREIIQSRG